MEFAPSLLSDISRSSRTVSIVASTSQIQLDIPAVWRSGHRFNDYQFSWTSAHLHRDFKVRHHHLGGSFREGCMAATTTSAPSTCRDTSPSSPIGSTDDSHSARCFPGSSMWPCALRPYPTECSSWLRTIGNQEGYSVERSRTDEGRAVSRGPWGGNIDDGGQSRSEGRMGTPSEGVRGSRPPWASVVEQGRAPGRGRVAGTVGWHLEACGTS